MAKNVFNTISLMKPKRNHFDMSYDRKFSCNMGELVPIHLQEVLPGDKISMKSTQMIRFAPLVSPMMQRVDVYTHFFFVPSRLLWSNWESFITGGEIDPFTGVIPPPPVYPTINVAPVDIALSSIPDYLGIPTGTSSVSHDISALPFAAYAKIYDEYYRDQNLQEPINFVLNDGDNDIREVAPMLLGKPLKRAWEHDYFTSSLPFAQKGAEVVVPLGNDAPIHFTAQDDIFPTPQANLVKDAAGNIVPGINPLEDNNGIFATNVGGLHNPAYLDNSANLTADLSGATQTSINDLRRAFKLQEWLEKNARGGSRYIETILSHFGVQSKDSRLQRPEYLGGGKSQVSISEVLQTSGSAPTAGGYSDTPQGNLAGHGINVGQSNNFSRFFEEHGFVIGIMSVMPKPSYQQGLQRMWNKFDKLDYYWPSFAHIGEQEVKNKEIYWGWSAEADEQTFGYVPRYSEYRYMPSSVHGDFRDSLSYWHQGRIFETPPALNAEFIECNPSNRVFALQDPAFDNLYCQVFHEIHAIRPIPKFGIPIT